MALAFGTTGRRFHDTQRLFHVIGRRVAGDWLNDPADQRAAEASVASNLPDSGGQFTAAVVSVDPTNGAVRALVGGPDFAQSKFNLATDAPGRQAAASRCALESASYGFAPKPGIETSVTSAARKLPFAPR